MSEDSEIVIRVAKAMFEQVHGYHPDLNWDNAYPSHKDLYLKFARIAEPLFEWHFKMNIRDYADYFKDMVV